MHDKKFALSSKFFEYVFEPMISSGSRFFYEIDFHLFISNILYIILRTQRSPGEDVLNRFLDMMRRRESTNESLFSLPAGQGSESDNPLESVREVMLGPIGARGS